MSLSKADLLLHPIRGRILMVLSRRQMSTRQIAQALPDVSQASVYRHVGILTEAGVLTVAREVPVRGLVERFYVFNEDKGYVRHEEIEEPDLDDYLRYFQVFVDDLMQHYRLYSAHPDANPKRDGVGFWGEILYLTRQERDDLITQIHAVSQEFHNHEPRADRLRFYAGHVLLPEGGRGTDSDPAPADESGD